MIHFIMYFSKKQSNKQSVWEFIITKIQRFIYKNYIEDKDFYSIAASHNGYEKKFGYIHTEIN